MRQNLFLASISVTERTCPNDVVHAEFRDTESSRLPSSKSKYIFYSPCDSLFVFSNRTKPNLDEVSMSQAKTRQAKTSQAKPSRVENKGRKEKDPDTVFASSCDLLAALKTAKTDREIPQVDRFTTSDRNRRPWNFRWRYITKTCIGLTRGKERTKPRSFDVFRFAE